MLFAAEDEAATGETSFFAFDIIMILFTIVIAIGLIRLLKAPKRNLFAIGFTGFCLAVFLVADLLMVLNWLGIL